MTQAVTIPVQETKAQGQWSYEDYVALPDDGRRYEIIEGVLYVSNAPDIDHQYTVAELVGEIRQFVKAQGLGYVLTAPFEVHLSERSRPVQPDVLFIRSDRWPAPGAKFFAGAPDLVVEVVSPSSARSDQFVKFDAYERAGVPEYWIVHPRTHAVQVFTLSGGEYAELGEFVAHEVIQSAVLPGLAIVVSALFNR
ncbi:Uma2 family endonuclease [Candidatus Amarolinea aalborgensis]|jgi:Uma2 family endonuclease|uniref:Uma2 family endonuclease n=1 Tax=Candidatus Amarolinea aalborgensis TaxID=2249329 RepID=UPI003BF9AA5A